MPLSPGTRLGPYEVTAQIGVGGMGEVYRGRDATLNRDVAIKVLLPAVANDAERLGRRLTECAGVLAGLGSRTAEQIFGEVDALKLCSSMTLFARAAPGEPVFRQVLEQYFGGMTDPATEQRV